MLMQIYNLQSPKIDGCVTYWKGLSGNIKEFLRLCSSHSYLHFSCEVSLKSSTVDILGCVIWGGILFLLFSFFFL